MSSKAVPPRRRQPETDPSPPTDAQADPPQRQPVVDAQPGLPQIEVGDDAGSITARRGMRKSRQRTGPAAAGKAGKTWWLAAGGAMGALLAVVIGVVIYSLVGSQPIEQSVGMQEGERRQYRPQRKQPAPAKSRAVLLPAQRPAAAASAKTGLDVAQPSQTFPQPKVTPAFDRWLQDFEAAKQQAAERGKSILFLFNGSDWCGFCRRLASEVLLKPEFEERAGKDYLLVYLDFPRSAEAQAKVEDPERNDRLKARFGVSGYPAVVLTDHGGQPFGVIEGYVPGGVDAFMQRLDRCQSIRKQLAGLFHEIETAGNAELKRETVAAAVQLLQENRLSHWYRSRVEQWLSGRPQQPPGQTTQQTPGQTTGPAEPPKPKIALSEEDLEDPEAAMAKLGLRAQSGYLCLPEDAKFRARMRGAEPLRRKAFQTQQEVEAAEQKVKQKQQLITAYLQKRRELRAQLSRTTSLDRHVEMTGMLNELADRVGLLQESDREEKAAKAARATANAATEEYVESLLQARKMCDEVTERYADLAADTVVKTAVEKYGEVNSQKYKLGPSPYFLTEARKLKKLEDTVLAEEIDLRRGEGDLWHVSVVFNGKFAREIAIDTGASVIALPWKTAQDAGLAPTENSPTVRLQMADGRIIEGWRVFADTVRVGKFTVENVECAVMPQHLTEADPLLGLSFLKNFSFKIDTARAKLILSKIDEKGG